MTAYAAILAALAAAGIDFDAVVYVIDDARGRGIEFDGSDTDRTAWLRVSRAGARVALNRRQRADIYTLAVRMAECASENAEGRALRLAN